MKVFEKQFTEETNENIYWSRLDRTDQSHGNTSDPLVLQRVSTFCGSGASGSSGVPRWWKLQSSRSNARYKENEGGAEHEPR
ncbi:hypothetical protein Q5P01_015553 [Channa striata]|uniref:Uncharacterized protein n=1 Tax=Channa striata TaxID=64152 RepID=A0AA88MDK9_CHASR|nr:hypothetical protein Q5P01_015553 [Channa striata]